MMILYKVRILWRGVSLKILIYGLTDTYGGVEAYVLDRLPALLTGNQVDLVFSTMKEIKYISKVPSEISIRKMAKLSSPFKFMKDLRDLIKLEKYDIVYCNLPFANALLYITVKLCGCQLIVHSHNTRIEESKKVRRLILTFYHYISKYLFSGLIDKKYGCSLKACKWLFYANDSYSIKRNAIDCKKYVYNQKKRDELRKHMHIDDTTFVVGHVGRFSYQKNHHFLIKIFNEIVKEYQNSLLLLIGDGEYRSEIELECNRLGIRSKVKFLGIRNDVNELMQVMDCFLLPSRFEGLPIVGIEAQAAGLPCFFSDTITTEVKLTPLVHFFSLNENVHMIARLILEMINVKRVDMLNLLIESGYDLSSELKNKNHHEEYI